jgi:hypothetical protein
MRRQPSAILAITVAAGLTAATQPALASPAGRPAAKADKDTAAPAPAGAVDPKMRAQQPLVEAAIRLRRFITTQRNPGFTSISLGDRSVDLRWKGVLPASVRTAIAAEKGVRVTVAPARHSLTDLKAAERQLLRHIKDSHGPVFGVRVPADGSGLVALTTKRQTETTVRGLRRAALATSTVPLRAEVAPWPQVTGRVDDIGPFWGGADLIDRQTGGRCSTGFGVSRGTLRWILTAGHCGAVGHQFANGTGTWGLGMGNWAHDSHDLLLVTAAGGDRIFLGGGLKWWETRPQYNRRVGGWAPTFPGEWVCQSGAQSGEVCNIRNSANVSASWCAGGICRTDLVWAEKLDGIAVRRGDSGGPVFTSTSTPSGLRAIAKGIVSGQNGYPFKIMINGKCLDADSNTIGKNGTRVQLWTCNNSPQQMFVMRADGIINSVANGSFCLDADLNTIANNGTFVQLWTCNGSTQQRWIYGGEGAGSIRSAYSGRCIDADLNTLNQEGTRLQLWDCNGQGQQMWTVPSSAVMYQDFATANQDFGIAPVVAP